jgi:transcription initiation factor TFIIF subunit alpha
MKPVLGEDGLQIIEIKEKADMDLIGGSEQRKARKKAIKEVYHQEKNVMRLRREEATPWVLETGSPSQEVDGQVSGGKVPEHWVGRYVDPHSLPTVLFVNDGQSEGFQVIPLGRTYKFEPERPFKVLDPDASHKLVRRTWDRADGEYEQIIKTKVHDRWAQREGGRTGAHNPVAGGSAAPVKREAEHIQRLEARVRAMEQRIKQQVGEGQTKAKVERFDDDSRREGRGLERVSPVDDMTDGRDSKAEQERSWTTMRRMISKTMTM